MTQTTSYRTVSLKSRTHERIKNEADTTGIKMWALVERMADSYFEKIKMEA